MFIVLSLGEAGRPSPFRVFVTGFVMDFVFGLCFDFWKLVSFCWFVYVGWVGLVIILMFVGLVICVLCFLFMLWFVFVGFVVGVFVVFVLFSLFLSVALCGFVVLFSLFLLRDIVCMVFGVGWFWCGCVCVVCFILVGAFRNAFMCMFLF